jgi:hypothetical protein
MSPKYTVANNESDVRQGISVESGYPGCPDCAKILTYTSSALTSYSWMYNASVDDKGYLSGRVHVGITNNQPSHDNVYFLKVEQTNSGIFIMGASVYLVDNSGNKKSLSYAQINGYGLNKPKECSNNIGQSCWWTDNFWLTAATLNQAIDSGKPLTLFIGQNRAIAANDGFSRTVQSVPVGVTITISNDYLKIFRDELSVRGVQLPSTAELQ